MSFAWKGTFTVTGNSALLPATLTDFPVLVSVTDNALKLVANGGQVTDAGGDDIVFCSDSGLTTILSYELERYNGTTGEVQFWVKIASLSLSLVFYAGIGDSAITTFQGGALGAAWISAYQGVYHLPDGTTLAALDSTANAVNGTITGAVAGTGKIDGAGSFTRASSHHIALGTSSNFSFINTTAFSVSAWVNTVSISNGQGIIVKLENSGAFRGWSFDALGGGSAGKFRLVLINDTSSANAIRVETSAAQLVNSTWSLVHATYDGSQTAAGIVLYANGVAVGMTTVTNGLSATLANSIVTEIGIRSASSSAWDGLIDEARISTGVRTANWITAEFNNQSDPATFITSSFAANGIAFDATSNSGYNTADDAYTWSHTCTGANRYLLVGVSMLSVAGSSVSAITYNGVALSLLGSIASVSGAVRVEIWGLVAPATGSNTISVTLSAALDSAAGAISLTGVHQTVSTEGVNTASATNVGAADATVNITTVADNDWVIDMVASDDTAITVGSGQTSRVNVTGALGSGAASTEGPKTPAGSVTMNWTNVAALATWSTVGVAMRPIQASGNTSVPVIYQRRRQMEMV